MRLAHSAATALARRGHDVTLVCESFDASDADADSVHPISVLARVQSCHRAGVNPSAFAAFARQHVRAARASGTPSLSFSTLASASVWAPIPHLEPIADTRFDDAVHEWMLLKGLRRRLLEARVRRNVAEVDRLLLFAPRTHRPRHAIAALNDRSVNIGFVSPLRVPTPVEAARLREQTRRLLNLDSSRRAILCSTDGRSLGEIAPIMAAIAHLHRQRRPDAPTLVVLAHEPAGVSLAASRAGLSAIPGALCITRTTQQPEALLAAADIIAIVHRAADAHQPGPARLLCDALRMGKPVIAARTSPGAQIIDAALRAADAPPAPGLLVSDNTPAAWYHALAEALSADQRVSFPAPPVAASHANAARPSAVARALADLHSLDLESFVDRLERALAATHALV